MLVVNRTPDKDIIIGTGHNAAIVRVLRVRGNRVDLGIGADDHIPIHRREVAERNGIDFSHAEQFVPALRDSHDAA
jgi:sRNA-binding carbon storage regulator CsrA